MFQKRHTFSSKPRTNGFQRPFRGNFKKKFGPSSMSTRDLMEVIQTAKQTQKSESAKEVFITHKTFAEFPILETLKKNIESKSHIVPTPIQDQAIPVIMEGKDIIGIANTGTGKTGAFLIPLIDKVYKRKQEKVLIITPTRELALQIYDELHSFAKGMGIYAVLCIGGMSMGRQRNELRRNPSFVIGTPGRLKDLIQERGLQPSQFGTVVLDEADRMVDIGFIQDIKYFISLLPSIRQSLFFSATISGKVREILQAFVRNPVTVSVKQQDAAENINQDIIRVEQKKKKIEYLHNLLIKSEFQKVLVFGRTKWGIQKLTDELIQRGFKAGAIHGNKRQSQRQKILDQFKRNEIKILLATDVASRGLDIKDVSHVINYDIPASYEDYIHRIGRTGRANKNGVALTFIE